MGKVEQITIGLPIELSEAVRKAVADGEFSSTDEAVIAALEDWKESRDNFGRADEDLGTAWDVGVASGKGAFQSADEIIAESRLRQAAKP